MSIHRPVEDEVEMQIIKQTLDSVKTVMWMGVCRSGFYKTVQ